MLWTSKQAFNSVKCFLLVCADEKAIDRNKVTMDSPPYLSKTKHRTQYPKAMYILTLGVLLGLEAIWYFFCSQVDLKKKTHLFHLHRLCSCKFSWMRQMTGEIMWLLSENVPLTSQVRSTTTYWKGKKCNLFSFFKVVFINKLSVTIVNHCLSVCNTEHVQQGVVQASLTACPICLRYAQWKGKI